MFKSIDIFKLLTRTFVKENKDYKFKKFSNIFVVLELQKETLENPGSTAQKWIRFEELIDPGRGWKIKTKNGAGTENLYGFLKQCLKQAQRCLKGKSSLSKERLKTVFEKAPEFKELILMDYEEFTEADAKESEGEEPTNNQDIKIEELPNLVKEDLALLDDFGTSTTGVKAKIDEMQPFEDVPGGRAAYKKLIEPDDKGVERNACSSRLKKDYQRSKSIIRKDRHGDIFPFLKLQIESYIKTNFPPSPDTGSSEPGSFDLDIKKIPWPVNPYYQGIISQLTQKEPNLFYVEKDKTIISYMAIDYIKNKQYILCQLVFSSNYFKLKGLLKSESKQFRSYLGVSAIIRSALREFIEKNPIDNDISLTPKQLNEMLNKVDLYRKKLSEALVSIPLLLFKLIDLGWESQSLDELFKETFDFYKNMLGSNSRMDEIIVDFIQIEYETGRRKIKLQGNELDVLTESLEALALQVINKKYYKGKELISTIFNILQRFASDLRRVISTYQKINELRADIESMADTDFTEVAFSLFKKENWNESYQELNEQMRGRIKQLAKTYLKRKIDSPDDLNRMEKQYKTLGPEELNIKLTGNEIDEIIEPIIRFAGENKTIPGCIEQCRQTITVFTASNEKDRCFGEFIEINYAGLFDDNRHLVVFLNVYLNRNWDKVNNALINIEKDIHRIFLEAVGSLLEEKDAKSKIKSNLNILKDINLEVQDNSRNAILKYILKRSSIYILNEQTLIKLSEKNIPAVIITVVEGLKDQEYTTEEELLRVLELNIGRKLSVLKKIKIEKAELDHYKNSISEHAKSFIKNEERLSRYLEVLTVVYGDQQEKVSTFEKFSKIRMSHSNILDENFVQVAFKIFAAYNWQNSKIPDVLEKEIKKVFFRTFYDANVSNDDVKENLRILTVDFGFPLTDDERATLDENWREKIKIMIDRTYDKNKNKINLGGNHEKMYIG